MISRHAYTKKRWLRFLLKTIIGFGCGLAGISNSLSSPVNTPVNSSLNTSVSNPSLDPLPRLFFTPQERSALMENLNQAPSSQLVEQPNLATPATETLNQSWHLEAIVMQAKQAPKIRINGFFVPHPNFPFQLKAITATSVIFVDPTKRLSDVKVMVGQTYQPGLVPNVIPSLPYRIRQARE